MKILRETRLSIIIALLLISGVTYAQRPAEESYGKGVVYAIQGEFNKAKEEFEKALRIDSLFNPAWLSLEIIEDVIEQKIKNETAIHFFKGISYANNGQHDLAIREFNMAIDIDPKYAKAYNNRGGLYNNKGQHDLAINDYNKAIEIDPEFADAYNNRGLSHDIKEQYDLAISDYNKAIEIDPKNGKAYNYRGLVYLLKLENKVKGCADLKKACELGDCGNYNLAKRRGYCS
jgi:tetratricopeptide (TPR) repeat protein